jgi:hypothetical protein
VKYALGHRNINNTMKYMHLANSLLNYSEEWICRVAKTIEEAQKLIENGFEYITTFEGIMIFRKRK